MQVLFLQTGGTIDKDYPRSSGGWAFEIHDPAVERLLKKLNPSFEYKIISLMRKDSLEITDEDREKIKCACISTEFQKIIITHGTDTIVDTANYIGSISNKAIVLSGAMKPERFANSDAGLTIGSAIGAINLLNEGTYVAMHGVVKKYNEINRDKQTGQYI